MSDAGWIRIAAYWPEDFDTIGEPANVKAIGDLSVLREAIVPEYARTGFLGNRPVAAAGVAPMWPGVAQGWLILASDVAVPVVRLVAAFRTGLREIAAEGRFHRIQADVQADFPMGARFLRVLGFVSEGPLRAYGSDGGDFERFAYVDRTVLEGHD